MLPALISLSSIVFTSNSASAAPLTYSVTIDPSLTINLEDNLVRLDLNPVSNPFDSHSLNVSVSTNNATGYYMTMSTTNDNTNLVNTNNPDYYIPTLPGSGSIPDCSAGCSETNFPVNRWGYKIGESSVYLPFVSGVTVAENTAPAISDTTNLTFASKVDYDTRAGLYATTLNFTAVSKPVPVYMQYITSSACTATPLLVTDIRDGEEYYIQRLADGKCWMIQNLRLGTDKTVESSSVTLTPEDSNVAVTTTFNNKLPAPGVIPSSNMKEIIDSRSSNKAYVYDGWVYYCTPTPGDTTQFVGCYYNWYTATAGTGTENSPAQENDAPSSICPKGWALPKGGTNGDFQTLYNNYPSASQMLVTNPTTTYDNINGTYKPGILLSGYYDSNGANIMSVGGYYWSRTNYSTGMGCSLVLNTSTVYYNGNNDKYRAFPVRCLLQE